MDLFEKLHHYFQFTIDGAASKENALLPVYFTEETDGLKQLWRKDDRLFVNPPYSKVKDWVKKAAESEAQSIFLVASRTDTRWWHESVVGGASWIIFYKGRLKFNGMATPAPFPSAIVGYNCPPPVAPEILKLGHLVVLRYGDIKA